MSSKRDEFAAVILDMDGVITKTARVHARAWQEMFDDYLRERGRREGRELPPFDPATDYARYVDGIPRYDGVRRFLESRQISVPEGDANDAPDRETVQGLGNRKNQRFRQLIEEQGVEVWLDARTQIDRWKDAGVKVAVISSSRNCETVLRAAELLERFDAKVDGNDLQRLGIEGKPAPDVFLCAARQMNVRPAETMVVEDAELGVQAAKTGGFRMVVGVARSDNRRELQQAGADRVVGNLMELDVAKQNVPDSASTQADHSMRPIGRPDTEQARPNALERRGELRDLLQSRELALFLDYDGTLTPIVRRPEDATIDDSLRRLLRQLAGVVRVAIVSGRDRADVERMVAVEDLIYAGSHGFDIRGPALRLEQQDAVRALPQLDAVQQQLERELRDERGVRVERKRFAIAVHYREAASEDAAATVERVVDRLVGEYGGLKKKRGKMIVEIQPDVDWDKGRAVAWLAEQLQLNRPNVVRVYIGDDVTDEDAFRALRAHSPPGIGIRVAEEHAEPDDAPRPSELDETAAQYDVRNCQEVRQLLEFFLATSNQHNHA